MSKFLPILIITTLLLTGCSTPTPESEPKYDELELIKYENCLQLANKFWEGERLYQVYRDNKIAAIHKDIEKTCEPLKPEKK